MRKRAPLSTKDRIEKAAWELFQLQGYEETTISQILDASSTSRSSFYKYFRGKEDLLFSIAYVHDTYYEEWFASLDPGLHTVEKLKQFNFYVMQNLETSPYRSFFPTLYGLQVMTSGARHVLNPERTYYMIISLLVREGILRDELHTCYTAQELTALISDMQIGMTYSWCLNAESFSLSECACQVLNPFLESLRNEKKAAHKFV